MSEAYIWDYIRTPIGRFGGSLAGVRADDLGAVPLKALELKLRGGRLALATMCIGVGQGIAIALEAA